MYTYIHVLVLSFSAARMCYVVCLVPFRSTRADRRVRAGHDMWHFPLIIGFTSSANYTTGHRNCATLGFYEPSIDTHVYTHFCFSYCTHSCWHCLACSRLDGLTPTHSLLMAYRRRNGRWNTVHNQNRIEQVWRVGIWKPAAGAAENMWRNCH